MTDVVEPYQLALFEFDHLPEELQNVVEPFTELANDMAEFLPDNPERDKMLDDLVAAKDHAVRARVLGSNA